MMKNIKKISDNLELSGIVSEKIESALNQIKTEQEGAAGETSYVKLVWYKRPSMVAVIVAVIVLCAATTFAAVNGFWSRGIRSELKTNAEQRKFLEDSGMVICFEDDNLAVNETGISIKPEMLITDGKVAFISLKIRGLELKEGENPEFVNGVFPDVSNMIGMSMTSYFVSDGMKNIDSGEGISECEMLIPNYKDEDGNLDYICIICASDKNNNDLYGKTIKIKFKDLGIVDTDKIWPNVEYDSELRYKKIIEGTWDINIDIPDNVYESNYTKKYNLNKTISNGITVDKVVISPISVSLYYHVKKYDDPSIIMISEISSASETIKLAECSGGNNALTDRINVRAMREFIDPDIIENISVAIRTPGQEFGSWIIEEISLKK